LKLGLRSAVPGQRSFWPVTAAAPSCAPRSVGLSSFRLPSMLAAALTYRPALLAAPSAS